MNNQKVKEIIKFSFYQNIQNKWFIIFNMVTLIGIILVVNWGNFSSLFQFANDHDVFGVAILDQSNLVYPKFWNDLSGDERFEITQIETNYYTAENIPDDFMIVEVLEDETEGFKVSMISKEGINVETYDVIKEELFKIRNILLTEKYHVDSSSLMILQSDLSINRVMLSVEGDESNTKDMINYFSSALTYFITIILFSKMANEIASEKQSKSTEYILTTVSAKEYLYAKIFSNIAWIILQGLLLLVYYGIAALILTISNGISIGVSLSESMTTNIFHKDIVYYVLTLIIYNVLNLILLCIVQATLASKTSSTTEAGNSMSFLLIIVMAAYFSTNFVLSPYEKVNIAVYIVSCLPLISAYFIPGMIVIGQATMLQIIISLVLLIVAIPITFHYCSRIFKNGILDYTKGKKKTKVEKSNEEKRTEFLNKREMKSFGFVIGVATIIYAGIQTILSLIGNMVLTTLVGNVLNSTEITMVLQILAQVISLGLASSFVYTYIEKGNDRVEKRNLNVKTKTKLILVALFLIFALQLFLGLVLYPSLGLDYNTTDLFKVNASSSLMSKIILVIALAIIPGIFEELFFRKAIINFSIKYGKTFALLFSALLFGLLHMNLSQGLFAFIMGLLLGAIYLYTGDIKITMFIHFFNNGFAALELILPEMAGIASVAILLIFLIIGMILFIKMFVKRETREKIFSMAKINVNLKSFSQKYQYIFTDYVFDVSLIFVFLMSIITEKILR